VDIVGIGAIGGIGAIVAIGTIETIENKVSAWVSRLNEKKLAGIGKKLYLCSVFLMKTCR